MENTPQGPAAEIEQVIRQYADMVYRLAYAWMRNPSDADDVFQDVFLRYAEKSPAFTDENHRRAWLLRVTVNRCKSHFRSSWWKRTAPLTAAPPVVFARQDEIDLEDALRRLSPKLRTVVHLHYYENLSTGEIAALTGQTPSTVRTQLTRARANLKAFLEGGDV